MVATFQSNKKKDWFLLESGLVFVYGEVCKGTSRNCVVFKMELFATIINGKKLRRTSSDGLTTNCLLKFAKHLSCQTPADARFNKNDCLHSIQILHDRHHVPINFQPTVFILQI